MALYSNPIKDSFGILIRKPMSANVNEWLLCTSQKDFELKAIQMIDGGEEGDQELDSERD